MMNSPELNDFQQIVILIEEARNRAFVRVNEELVLLYLRVGEIVSEKVSLGKWGQNTVNELAVFIEKKLPGFKGFNRRGLYRMKQFYETYSIASDCFEIWLNSLSDASKKKRTI